ncbi:Leucine Rich Repeat family protein [Tritrichomonas foetus]|uniref:Leucine Rich Repeat family protein n=1 Tax=Tritrichomonas foetus TaxID=1144522 RepID=A0A1J4JPM7_9EUKA|nr:Leucine Rich Repeat family protein [Tritrichomonas foetus]|eukprot:OHT01111.1 Leucine Rich Repeat family protein [Tritrichomonas foetus]
MPKSIKFLTNKNLMTDSHSNNGALTQHMILHRTRANSLNDVRAINMWGYELKDVSIFESMPNVEIVSLPMNEITTLKQFSFCPKLKELLLRHNQIDNFDELQYLSGLNGLHRLWLAENPIAEYECYRENVISILPQLEVLDEIPISDNERNGMAKTSRPFVNSIESQGRDNGQIGRHARMLSDDMTNKYRKGSPKISSHRSHQRLLYTDQYNYKNNQQSPKQNFTKNQNSNEKSDERALTAILALLPNLSPDSLSVVLEAISEL